MRTVNRLLVLAVVAGLAGCGASSAASAQDAGVKVVGNHLVDAAGKPLRLIGVNRSGTEFACTGTQAGHPDGPFGYAVFQGPRNGKSIKALRSWRVNAVALPLNEACWLGGYGNLDPAYSGDAYRSAVLAYVRALHRAGIYAVIRLSGAAPGDRPFGTLQVSGNEVPMADADHSVAFWSSVAAAFKDDPMVVFHAFDEPHEIDWACVRDGCTVEDKPDGKERYGSYQAVGHQALVTAIRAAGATQPIILSGPGYAGDLSQWLESRPNDPAQQLVANISTFDYSDYLLPHRAEVAKVAAEVPVIIGGFGDTDCNSDYSRKVMRVADRMGLSELAWTWNTVQDYGGCGNALLDGGAGAGRNTAYYTARPSGFGKGVRDHYRKLDALGRHD